MARNMKMVADKLDVTHDLEGPLGTLGQIVTGWLETYGPDAELQRHYAYDSHEYDKWFLHYDRPETDAERTARLKAAQKKREQKAADKAARVERDLAELARLKAKYESDRAETDDSPYDLSRGRKGWK